MIELNQYMVVNIDSYRKEKNQLNACCDTLIVGFRSDVKNYGVSSQRYRYNYNPIIYNLVFYIS